MDRTIKFTIVAELQTECKQAIINGLNDITKSVDTSLKYTLDSGYASKIKSQLNKITSNLNKIKLDVNQVSLKRINSQINKILSESHELKFTVDQASLSNLNNALSNAFSKAYNINIGNESAGALSNISTELENIRSIIGEINSKPVSINTGGVSRSVDLTRRRMDALKEEAAEVSHYLNAVLTEQLEAGGDNFVRLIRSMSGNTGESLSRIFLGSSGNISIGGKNIHELNSTLNEFRNYVNEIQNAANSGVVSINVDRSSMDAAAEKARNLMQQSLNNQPPVDILGNNNAGKMNMDSLRDNIRDAIVDAFRTAFSANDIIPQEAISNISNMISTAVRDGISNGINNTSNTQIVLGNNLNAHEANIIFNNRRNNRNDDDDDQHARYSRLYDSAVTLRKNAENYIASHRGSDATDFGQLSDGVNSLINAIHSYESMMSSGSVTANDFTNANAELAECIGRVNNEMSQLNNQSQNGFGVMDQNSNSRDNRMDYMESQIKVLNAINSFSKQLTRDYAGFTGTPDFNAARDLIENANNTQSFENLRHAVETNSISQEDFEERLKSTTLALKELFAQMGRAPDVSGRTATLAREISGYLDSNSAARYNVRTRQDYFNMNDTYNNLANAINSGDYSSIDTDYLNNVARDFAKFKVECHAANVEHKSFLDSFRNIGSTVSSYLNATRIVMIAVQGFKKMVSQAIDLNKALTEMQIVTNETASSMSKFASSISDVAIEIGGSTTDLVKSATTFARLGYSMDESEMLAKYTQMLSNVGAIDVSTASDAITAMVKAFDVDISDVESMMDKLVAVGNNFPISVEQISEGMNNASSALSSAGNTFEQSVALLTAANTTVQNASKAATGLRTISARLRNTKSELDDLGESMEEAKYDELVKALSDQNVSLVDAQGELRSTYDVLKDLASVWDDMSTMQQSAMATAIAGTRQQNVFFSIINQFKEASGAMEAMANSAGTLDKSYSIYMDSAQSHINQMKASFTGLSADLLDSSVIKFFTDLATSLLNTADIVVKLVDVFGGLKTVLASFASIKIAGLLGLTNLPTAAIVTAISAIGAIVNIVNTNKQKTEKRMLDASNDISSNKKKLSDLEEYASRVSELNKKLSDGNATNSEQVSIKKEILSIQGELIDKYGEEAKAIASIGDSAEETSKKLSDLYNSESKKTYFNYLAEHASEIKNAEDTLYSSMFVFGGQGNGFRASALGKPDIITGTDIDSGILEQVDYLLNNNGISTKKFRGSDRLLKAIRIDSFSFDDLYKAQEAFDNVINGIDNILSTMTDVTSEEYVAISNYRNGLINYSKDQIKDVISKNESLYLYGGMASLNTDAAYSYEASKLDGFLDTYEKFLDVISGKINGDKAKEIADSFYSMLFSEDIVNSLEKKGASKSVIAYVKSVMNEARDSMKSSGDTFVSFLIDSINNAEQSYDNTEAIDILSKIYGIDESVAKNIINKIKNIDSEIKSSADDVSVYYEDVLNDLLEYDPEKNNGNKLLSYFYDLSNILYGDLFNNDKYAAFEKTLGLFNESGVIQQQQTKKSIDFNKMYSNASNGAEKYAKALKVLSDIESDENGNAKITVDQFKELYGLSTGINDTILGSDNGYVISVQDAINNFKALYEDRNSEREMYIGRLSDSLDEELDLYYGYIAEIEKIESEIDDNDIVDETTSKELERLKALVDESRKSIDGFTSSIDMYKLWDQEELDLLQKAMENQISKFSADNYTKAFDIIQKAKESAISGIDGIPNITAESLDELYKLIPALKQVDNLVEYNEDGSIKYFNYALAFEEMSKNVDTAGESLESFIGIVSNWLNDETSKPLDEQNVGLVYMLTGVVSAANSASAALKNYDQVQKSLDSSISGAKSVTGNKSNIEELFSKFANGTQEEMRKAAEEFISDNPWSSPFFNIDAAGLISVDKTGLVDKYKEILGSIKTDLENELKKITGPDGTIPIQYQDEAAVIKILLNTVDVEIDMSDASFSINDAKDISKYSNAISAIQSAIQHDMSGTVGPNINSSGVAALGALSVEYLKLIKDGNLDTDSAISLTQKLISTKQDEIQTAIDGIDIENGATDEELKNIADLIAANSDLLDIYRQLVEAKRSAGSTMLSNLSDFKSSASGVASLEKQRSRGERVNMSDVYGGYLSMLEKNPYLYTAMKQTNAGEYAFDYAEAVKAANDYAKKTQKELYKSAKDFWNENIKGAKQSGEEYEKNMATYKSYYIQAAQAAETAKEVSNTFGVTQVNAAEDASNLLSAYNEIDRMMRSSIKGSIKDLSFEDVQKIAESYTGLIDALEIQNGHLVLNTEKSYAYMDSMLNEQVAKLQYYQGVLAGEWIKENDEVIKLEKSIKELEGEEKTRAENDKKNHEKRKDDLKSEIEYYKKITAALGNVSTTYNRMTAAMQMGDVESEMLDNIKSAIDYVNKALKSGKAGGIKFQEVAAALIPEDIQDKGIKAMQKYMTSIKKYFTNNEIVGLNKFINDLVGKGFAEKLSDGSIQIANKTLSEIAKGMGLTTDAVQSLFNALSAYYGVDVDLDFGAEEAEDTLTDMQRLVAAAESIAKAFAGEEWIEAMKALGQSVDEVTEKESEVTEDGEEAGNKLAGSFDEASDAANKFKAMLDMVLSTLNAISSIKIDPFGNGSGDGGTNTSNAGLIDKGARDNSAYAAKEAEKAAAQVMKEDEYDPVAAAREAIRQYKERGRTRTADERQKMKEAAEAAAAAKEAEDAEIDAYTDMISRIWAGAAARGKSEQHRTEAEAAAAAKEAEDAEIDAYTDMISRIWAGAAARGKSEQHRTEAEAAAQAAFDAEQDAYTDMISRIWAGAAARGKSEQHRTEAEAASSVVEEVVMTVEEAAKEAARQAQERGKRRTGYESDYGEYKAARDAEYGASLEEAKKLKEIVEEPSKVNVDTSDAIDNINAASNEIDDLHKSVHDDSMTITVNTKYVTSDSPDENVSQKYPDKSGIGGGNKYFKNTNQARAYGTKGADPGVSLVGELGREIVVSNGRYSVVGSNGPELVRLHSGDIVLNNKETEKALSGVKSSQFGGRAYADGASLDKLRDAVVTVNISPAGLKAAKGGKKTDSFDDLYKKYKHLVAIEQMTQKDFIDWLQPAMEEAYKNKKIKLDDYRKYIEEVYSGLRELFNDHLSDVEHTISMLEKEGGNEAAIANNYRNLLKDVEDELQKVREYGLGNDDSTVQELQDKWWEYYDALQEKEDEYTDDAEDKVKDLVDYRIKMIEKDYQKQKEYLSDKMSDLKDFYSKQKELLRDSYDEEDYLDEQAEKRKAVTDIEAKLAQLEYDNSAWAAKRKLELQEELTEATKELHEFERDHALEVAEDELDKLSEIQSDEIQKQIDAIDETLDNQEILYNQALKDMQNNNLDTYQEFLDYNRKYGTGEDSEIVNMWNEAYESLSKYYDLFGEYYKEINLINAAGYSGTSVLPKENRDNRIVNVPSVVSGRGWEAISSAVEDGVEEATSGTGSGGSSDKGATKAAKQIDFTTSLADIDMISNLQKSLSAAAAADPSGVTAAVADMMKNQVDKLSGVADGIAAGLAQNITVNLGDININGDNPGDEMLIEFRRAQRKQSTDLISYFQKVNVLK